MFLHMYVRGASAGLDLQAGPVYVRPARSQMLYVAICVFTDKL